VANDIMPLDLKEKAVLLKDKLSKIRVCIFDVDGVLSDGRVFYAGQEVGFNRFFNIQDGFGIMMLLKNDFKVGLISGLDSVGVVERAKALKLSFTYLGKQDKRDSYLDVLKRYNVTDEEVLYMGDDFIDLPLLKRVGFSATPPSASVEIQESVDYVSRRSPGMGCVREVIELLRYANDLHFKIEDF